MAKLLGAALVGGDGQYNSGEVVPTAPGDGAASGAWSPAPSKPSARASGAARGLHLGGREGGQLWVCYPRRLLPLWRRWGGMICPPPVDPVSPSLLRGGCCGVADTVASPEKTMTPGGTSLGGTPARGSG